MGPLAFEIAKMKIRLLTHPELLTNEIQLINALFAEGLACLNLRKPNFTAQQYEDFLAQIDAQYHPKIILHDHYELIEKYSVRGIHLGEARRRSYNPEALLALRQKLQKAGLALGSSVHERSTLDELAPNHFDYIFVSPVFSSISKQGYGPKEDWTISPYKAQYNFTIVGLGGIDLDSLGAAAEKGFEEVGALGSVWLKGEAAPAYFAKMLAACQDLLP